MMGSYDWRLAETNVWKVERMLLDYPHRPIASSDRNGRAVARALSRVPGGASRAEAGLYRGRRERWTELPAEFV